MDRYLVQFRERDQQCFTTDCGFRDGLLELAWCYVCTVLDTLDQVAEGRVLDVRSPRDPDPDGTAGDVSEKMLVAVFGPRQEFDDPNGSEGIDDDPFVQYEGPDDPKIRYV